MTDKEQCPGADGLMCMGGWLYSSINMMIFPANKRCSTCSPEEEKMMHIVVGRMYKHYKNGMTYVVEDLAMNPNTEEVAVIYREVAGPVGQRKYWRPHSEFVEKFTEQTPPSHQPRPASFA